MDIASLPSSYAGLKLDGEQLHEDARYGALPFDCFALSNWDFSRPLPKDKEQWHDLVLKWLAFTALERRPYHILGHEAWKTPAPTQEVIDRVLAPFQTTNERNAALRALCGRWSPMWLRTCYDPELCKDYKVPPVHFLTPAHILDDEGLYGGLESDWTQIYFRVPSIPDCVQIGEPEVESDGVRAEEFGEPEFENEREAHEAGIRERTFVYLIDREALRDKVIKLMWIDIHGNCVWDFSFPEGDFDDLQGPLNRPYFLTEIISRGAVSDQSFKRGARLSLT
ncbi:hypothetical protein GLAREA_04372 [Glarea lozoyensis ATCC 20868]|uniref:Uncharacterized protein n=1 Tax=Glarea lozoyensis (strain ATCC 20868 / MF5171) TaxID=1116229 RepID=S3D692_GLAL2|nr:uncharacterized protein GLAREA_04372 [Glarea lozoyensis ATCC 20868]EPE27581.1 hypothetical protein GLAREA_04372 [Glarea lozoyensis ATCC 20868]